MKPVKALIFSAAMLTGTVVLAHTDEYLDTLQAPHGGQLRMAGIYHFELVVVKDAERPKENPVVVYVTDHAGTKISTVGAGGTVTILAGKHKTAARLVPDGDNRLKGSTSYASTLDMKVVVSVAMPGKVVLKAHFTPLAAAKNAHADHMR
ncbi:MAG: hypothetical protein M0P95_09920 [Sulfuritalea sp.]|jgi:hypothetical protein|nr:hypothetical protein [Sulfuritalea sp.]